MANAGRDKDRMSTLTWNALAFPELITYGPERELKTSSLRYNICIKSDADRVPSYNYWMVYNSFPKDSAHGDKTLEAGDWICKINGSSTTDKGRPLLSKVTSKRNIQSLDVRKPLEHQTFNLWDVKQETLEFKAKEKALPFTLHIFHPNLNDTSKTFALVDEILQNKKGLKGLKRGDIVIAINDQMLLDKTHEELRTIVYGIKTQEKITLTIKRRQWRQHGLFTKYAIESPATLRWGDPFQIELRWNSSNKMVCPAGFLFVFLNSKHPLDDQFCIMSHIEAGNTPAAMCAQLNPGHKLTAINGQAVKGLSIQEVTNKLQRAKSPLVLTIEVPLSFLLEENFGVHDRESCCTWPGMAENGLLRKSHSEAQIHFTNSLYAYGLQTVDLTSQQLQQLAFSPNSIKDAECTTRSVPDQDVGYINGASSNPCCQAVSHEESATLRVLSSKLHETHANHDKPPSQNFNLPTSTDKRQQTIEDLPGEIYYPMCSQLDTCTLLFKDYRILFEKLGFTRLEVSRFNNSNQPTNDLFNEWLKRRGKEATVGALMEALEQMELDNLLEKLETWKGTGQSNLKKI